MIDAEMEESQSGKFKRAILLRSAYHYGGKFTLGSKAGCADAGAGIVSPKLYRLGERASPAFGVEPSEFSHGIARDVKKCACRAIDANAVQAWGCDFLCWSFANRTLHEHIS
jgi:hypothetical protein